MEEKQYKQLRLLNCKDNVSDTVVVFPSAHLQQRLSDVRILRAVEVKQLRAQTIIVRTHLVQVYHVGVCGEHGPPAFSVDLGHLHGQNPPLPLI